MPQPKNIAVIGAGPAGAIAVDALAREQVFDQIRVFERREAPGGCWLFDPDRAPPKSLDYAKLTARTADEPEPLPSTPLPVRAPKSTRYRFDDTAVYSYLETNIDTDIMAFTEEPVLAERTALNIARHGEGSPFRHHVLVKEWIQSLFVRKGYIDWVEFNTTVERAEKKPGEQQWVLTLRKGFPGEEKEDKWWEERFDALVVATGHYAVPYVPYIEGLAEFDKAYPGHVLHSKYFRYPEDYRGKRVVTVGASISGTDMAYDLAGITESPVHAVVRGRYHPYFGDWAFRNPHIQRHPPISRIEVEGRVVRFEDGTLLKGVDDILLGTGYSWTLPFLPQVPTKNNRVPGLYMHIFWQEDPTLTFVGAIAAGFTFRAFEWQAVYAARVLAGRAKLPPIEEQKQWEIDRIAYKGDSVPFTALYPDFEEYFERVRELAGTEGPGRKLPKWEKDWLERFNLGHLKRIEMWKNGNKQALEKLEQEKEVQQKGKVEEISKI